MQFSKADRSAYGLGIRQAQAGALQSMNPYSTGSSLGRSWLAGYAKGKGTPRSLYAADCTDLAYEDQCAERCGL